MGLGGTKRPERSQAGVCTAPRGGGHAGRSAGRAVPHGSAPRSVGGTETLPQAGAPWPGSNARPAEQHSQIVFIAGAGMLQHTFPFLFMSGGLGFVLFASCSQRISWTAFLGTWLVLYVYHHSLYIVHAVPWVLANILTQRTEINPPKLRGTDCFLHDDSSLTSEVTASAQNFLFSSKRHSSNRNNIYTCPQHSFKAYIILQQKRAIQA